MEHLIYSYEAPDLTVVEASVERGFAATKVDPGNAGVYAEYEDEDYL
jgi:hypothetical protein